MHMPRASTAVADDATRPATRAASGAARWAAAALLAITFLTLYIPVMAQFGARYFWDEDDNHALILVLLAGYAFYADRSRFAFRSTTAEAIVGGLVCLFGLCAYLLGRITDIVQLQGGSLPLLALGCTLGLGGQTLLRRWWLPCCLLMFIVPLIGGAADAILVPMRLAVTDAAVAGARFLGYPAAANGVLISVGFVQLSVAGACVGLRSMVSMVAIAALFLHFFPPRSTLAGVLFFVGAAIVALGANFVRVLTLVLVAGQFGATAEATVHDLAAYIEVILALGAFLLLARITAGPSTEGRPA